MNSELSNKDYYIGLDCGTSSVGFAVTDTNYELLKFNGKAMWGSHMFEEAKTAQERRGYRCARRRRDREIQRIKLLQSLFSEEVFKVDSSFFIRLNESKYLSEDKSVLDGNILFNDKSFKDKDFFKKYPTAYHLRSDLIKNGTTDIRFLYLALHHILKHRGHFLFPGENMTAVVNLEPLVNNLEELFCAVFEIDFNLTSLEEFEQALRNKNKTEKTDTLSSIILIDDKKLKANVIKILLGYKIAVDKFFNNDDYSDCCAIEFKKASFEEEGMPILEETLNDDEFRLITTLKAIYDWILFSDVMGGQAYISDAKIQLYDNNRKDLRILKTVIKKYVPQMYNEFFHSRKDGFFSSYVGKNHDSHSSKEFRVKKTNIDSFYKEVGNILKKCPQDDSDVEYVEKALEDSSFMPLLSSYRNGVIPYQVNKIELDAILNKAKLHFAFLADKDESGLSVAEKIVSLMTFRIPYYIGPLGHNAKSHSKNTWMERREEGRIYPWNFNDKVDVEASAEKFILRMTNKCTYCKEEDVLPKNSIAYSKYLVLSELNNLRVKGQRLPVSVKQDIYNDLFSNKKKVTIKSVKSYLINQGYFKKTELSEEDFSGLESDFKSSLGSYIDFKQYMMSGQLKASDVDLIIKWITVFPEGGQILRQRIEKQFGDSLSAEEITRISKMKYAGWGRFSRKFLYGIQTVNHETGEKMSVVSMMWNTEKNLMELLSNEYEFKSQIGASNPIGRLDYSVVDNLYVSPAVKRQIWQTLRIVGEIERIMKHPPKKVFIETTRSNDRDNKKTKSRKTDLIDKLKDALKTNSEYVSEFRELLKSLEGKTDSQISIQDKLYLYYTQCGRCMYSGETIDIENLYRTEIYDVDHIYPYSKTNDDSLKNRVLVLHTANTRKSDSYPITDDIRTRMEPFWRMLKDRSFIPKEKYDRLTRVTPLSETDIEDFINRQLVETSQSTKASAEILRQYFGENTRVVYSKAGNVSQFRHEYNLVKCRSVNDLHHAKDAYLNIVVGNVYDTKYTGNFFRMADGRGYGNLSTPFKYDVANAWKAGDSGSIKTVLNNVSKNNILYTKQPLERGGQLYDLQLVPKGSKAGALPAKTSDVHILRLLETGKSVTEVYDEWTAKYGGYNSLTTAYFALVQHEKKGKKYAQFVPISIVDSKRLSDRDALKEYCSTVLGLANVRVLIERLLMGAVVEIDGFRFIITGKSNGGAVVTLSSCVPLVLSEKSTYTVKKIESFEKKLKDNRNLIVNPEFDNITEENTLELFEELVRKSECSIYQRRPGNQYKLFHSEEARLKFINLSLNDRCSVIIEMLKYYSMSSGCANLELIGGTKACGTLTKGASIDLDKNKISIINQSITGLFEKKVCIS